MGSMGGLYIGVSGLNVSQAALNTTAHNIANVDTKGFVRQQVILADRNYITFGQKHLSSLQKGNGANVASVMQVRDRFLDQAYRRELGRQAFYESQYKAVEEVENLFGELEGVAFQNSMQGMWTAIQELSKQPDSIVARASLIQTAVSFIERADNISKQLNDYQVNLNSQIINQVKRVNEIGDQINQLNKKVRQYESNGLENANDLRDQRNVLIDELSKIVHITNKEHPDGAITVNVEGVPFVTEDTVYKMDTAKIEEQSELLKPVWVAHDMDVFNFDIAPNSTQNTDIGSLKGLLLSRGHKQANYTDIPVKRLDQSEAQYEIEVKKYNNEINNSVIMNVQAQFDQLIRGIVTMINDTLSPNKEITLSDGSKLIVLDEDNAPAGMDPNSTMGEALFNRKSVDRYSEPQEVILDELDEFGDPRKITVRVYNQEVAGDNYSLFTLGEITVNPRIMNNYSLIPLSLNTGTGDFDIKTAQKLSELWQKPFATLSPNTLTINNFNDYYNAFIADIANKGEQLNTISTNQASMVASIDNQRMQVMAVSSDEELTNLIKYQHAYNAAARYVNVVSEMLEHIVTRM